MRRKVMSKSDEVLPDWVYESFHQFQEAYFGQQVLSIVATHDCEACADSKQLKVFVDPKFIDWLLAQEISKDPREVFKFILAHEIGHYAYELYVSLNGASPNGFPGLLAGAPLDSGMRGHIEIDLFALAIYKKLGLDFPKGFVKLLESMESPPVSAETKLRLSTLEDAKSLFE